MKETINSLCQFDQNSAVRPGGNRVPSRRKSDIGADALGQAMRTRTLPKPQQIRDQEQRSK